METLTIRRPDDFHVHLRQGEALRFFARATAEQFARALVMPNTKPPIFDAEDALRYRAEIKEAAPGLEPLMTVYLTENTRPETILEAHASGIAAAKFYPCGGTTNAGHGVKPSDLHTLYPALQAMEECGMVLCLHGENPDAPLLEREKAFLPHFEGLCIKYPKLRIVLEHVSSKEGVATVKQHKNAAATVTLHHLILTHDDVPGQPHHHCMPCAKSAQDRDALLEAVCDGQTQFFFGSDSAPHPAEEKNSANPPAGVFTAPVALPLLAETLESHGALHRLENFTSVFGANFYRLPFNEGTLTLRKTAWTVPAAMYGPSGYQPFFASREIAWSI